MTDQRIFRYTVPVTDEVHEIECGKILHVGPICRQTGVMEFWALSEPTEKRFFVVVGTGFEVPKNGTFLGTSYDAGGTFVWHLYEVSGD